MACWGERKGLGCQTLVKTLLHEALREEEGEGRD